MSGGVGAGRRGARVVALATAGLFVLSPAAGAAICTVPGSHPTIQAAIDDPTCDEIELGPQVYPESIDIPRSLILAGPGGGGAVVEGLVRAAGLGTMVELRDLAVHNDCPRGALRSLLGARIGGSGLEVVRSPGLPCPPSGIFEDGFESGDVAAWDSAVE